jgi:hypothetical protein
MGNFRPIRHLKIITKLSLADGRGQIQIKLIQELMGVLHYTQTAEKKLMAK